MDEFEKLVFEYQPKFEEFVDKARELGILDSSRETLKLFCGNTTIYFGSLEIEQMKIKAECFDRMTNVLKEKNNELV